MTRRGRTSGRRTAAGRAIGWWIAGFEERLHPERQTVEERVRWGTETRASSGPGSDLVVRFPDEPASLDPGDGDERPMRPGAAPAGDERPMRPGAAPAGDEPPVRPGAAPAGDEPAPCVVPGDAAAD